MILILIFLENPGKSFSMLTTDQKDVSSMLSLLEEFWLCPLKKYFTINSSMGSRYLLMIVTRLDLESSNQTNTAIQKRKLNYDKLYIIGLPYIDRYYYLVYTWFLHVACA